MSAYTVPKNSEFGNCRSRPGFLRWQNVIAGRWFKGQPRVASDANLRPNMHVLFENIRLSCQALVPLAAGKAQMPSVRGSQATKSIHRGTSAPPHSVNGLCPDQMLVLVRRDFAGATVTGLSQNPCRHLQKNGESGNRGTAEGSVPSGKFCENRPLFQVPDTIAYCGLRNRRLQVRILLGVFPLVACICDHGRGKISLD